MSQKKWTSFEEMYLDLKEDPRFADSIKEESSNDIRELVRNIEAAKTSKDFFDLTCRLSSLFESLDEESARELYTQTNVYTLVLNAALRNQAFIEALFAALGKDKSIADLKKKDADFEILVLLNTAISLAFFGIAINYRSINKVSVEFLRKNITDLLKNILRQKTEEPITFVHLCYFLERIAWDNRLHFNENNPATFPIKLDSKFLFENLKLSRSFAGIAFTSLVIRPAIEERFKKIISSFDDDRFSISFALDSIFTTANELDEKINHYYRTAPKDIVVFFDSFIKKNERNMIFCFTKFCSGFHYQGKSVSFFQIVSNKLKTAPVLEYELISYTKEKFAAFNKQLVYDDDEWTNKLFLISIKTLAVLNEVKDARDSKWAVSVAIYELRQWIIEIHEVLNKYYIEDDWEKIKDFLTQENERVEWKSSFFTPLEQEYRDEIAEAAISKRLFEAIQKVILAMLNTDGGNLIVGVVENPEVIKRAEAEKFLMKKNGITFFDINFELRQQRKTLDQLRLQILENLRQTTDKSTDHFNGLLEFEPIVLRDNERSISIIRISVKKAEKPFFNVRKESGSIWLSLTKRAQGQNIDVDIREHI